MFDLRDRSAIAVAIRDALENRSRADLILASHAFADWQEEHADRPDIAACYRAAAAVYRWPGVAWPQPSEVEGVSDHQREALYGALCLPFCLLTGTPGTGKTYTLAAIVKAVAKKHGQANVAVAAPTGKAAVRIGESMARYGCPQHATTLHALLEIGRNGHDGEGWGFRRNGQRPLTQRFLFIDEASMLDTSLLASLLHACPIGTHLMLVGDPHQLAPVGHGSPLRDMIAAGLPRADLTEVHRNDGGIVEACRQIRQGKDFKASKPADKERTNLLHVDAATADAAVEATIRIARRVEATDAEGLTLPSYMQVIVAANKNSPLGRHAVNLKLQAALNPDGMRVEGNPFRTGDKIICTRNGFHLNDNAAFGSREVYVANGEMGSVFEVEGKVTRALFSNPERSVRIPMARKKADDQGDDEDDATGSGCDFDLGWAITCHKAQGSEWPIVVVLIDDSGPARRVCTREWLYTAISRASRQCLLVGRLPVAQQMSRRASLERRKTFLRELLTAKG